MSTSQRTPNGLSRLRSRGGYSLVEMMVAIGVASVIGLAIFAVVNSYRKSGESAKIYNDMQTRCNFAMDQMKAEILLAGYHAKDQERPISVAAGNTITFEYYDDNARDDALFPSTDYLNNTQVVYSLVAGELERKAKRYPKAGTWTSASYDPQILATNVAALSFEYLAGGGAAWDGLDQKDIRSVRVSLTCDASRPDPNTKKTPRMTLVAEVRARNAGVASTPSDVDPPGAPTGLIAWDPGSCGTLNLRWTANTEADLSGYTIYYGLAPGTYTDRVVLSRGPQTAGVENYTLTGLSSAMTGIFPQPRYYIAMSAYDKSGNVSTSFSAEISGNPTPTLAEPTGCGSSACATANTDTTPTPLVPDAPVALTATAGTNEITLSWTKSTAADLLGYRLFRSTDPSFTPDENAGTSNRIVDEVVLDADKTSYTDSGLLGCTTYYYQMATIACDTNIPIAGMLFASANAVPQDNTPPSPPVITARPGYRRIILTLTNPYADPDFKFTKVHWSTTANPTLTTVTPAPALGQPRAVILDGPAIPDNDTVPFNGAAAYAGRFTKTSTQSVNFNDDTNCDPSFTQPLLVPCTNWPKAEADACDPITYYFTAVAYDRCGNPSSLTASSIAQSDQCADCIVGDACNGAPYWSGGSPGQYASMGTANIVAEGCFDNVKLTWDSIDTTVQDDLAGFYVYRCDDSTVCPDGVGTQLTTEPIWNPEFVDSTPQIDNGRTYSYRVKAVDCYYERKAADSGGNYTYDSITNLSVGGIDLDPTMSDVVSGYLMPSTTSIPYTVIDADGLTSDPPDFRHDAVTFWVNNSANTSLTLQSASLQWENTNARLQQISFGDGDSTPITRLGWADTPPLLLANTGANVTLDAASTLLAKDEKIPFVVRFKNADGTESAATDSRLQTIRYDLTYRNESTNTNGCGLTGSIYVPRGPYVYGTTQDNPSAGTVAWPVPGASGSNARNVVTATGGTGVTVYTNVFDTSGDGLSSVNLYYYVDASRALVRAPDVATQYPNFTPPYGNPIAMERVAGSQWRTTSKIPISDNKNVWYFIVAVDTHGNFDREPEIDSGAFQYFQESANACLTTPRPPTLSGTASGTTVTLNWVAPVANTNGTSYTDAKGYWIYQSKNGASFTWLSTIWDKDNTMSTLTLADIETSSYRFALRAFDQCLPSAKYSDFSNIFTETVEDSCSNTPNTPALSGSTDGPNSSVTLNWTVPATNTSGSDCTDLAGYKIYRRTGSNSPTLYVPGPGGATAIPAGTTTYTDSSLADLFTEDYSYYVTAFDTCSSGAQESALSVPYIDDYSNLDPCATIPGNVTGFTGNVELSTKNAILTWNAPTAQSTPSGTPYNDPGGFYIYRSKDGLWQGTAAILPASSTSWTDVNVSATVGTSTYRYYIKAKDVCTPSANSSPTFAVWVEGYNLPPCDTLNPGPPTSLVVNYALTDSSGVALTWSDPDPNPGDIGGYVIESKNTAAALPAWGELSTSPVYHSETFPVTSFKDETVDPSAGAYCYRLKSFDSCATPNYGSAYSNEVCETYDPCGTNPDPPTGLTGSVDTSGFVTLSWTSPNTSLTQNQGLGGYKVYRQMRKNATATACAEELVGTVYNPAVTYWTDTLVSTSTWARIYTYRVASFKTCGSVTVDSVGSSPWTEAFSTPPCAKTPPPAPNPFTAVANTSCSTTETTARLTFTAPKSPTTGGAARSFARYYTTGGALFCDAIGCFTDADMCAPATALSTVTSSPTSTTSSTATWVTTASMPDFLKTNAYVFGVQAIEVKTGCRTVGPAATTTDTCN